MHALAKLGQLSLRTLAPKQVAAELVFEVPNGASERRLRHIAPFGSPGEIQLTGRRQEISDLLHFHSCSLPLNCERSVRRVSGRRLPSSPDRGRQALANTPQKTKTDGAFYTLGPNVHYGRSP